MMFDKNLAVSMVAFQQMYCTYNDNLTRTLSNTNDIIYCHHLTRVDKSTPNIPFFSGKGKKKVLVHVFYFVGEKSNKVCLD